MCVCVCVHVIVSCRYVGKPTVDHLGRPLLQWEDELDIAFAQDIIALYYHVPNCGQFQESNVCVCLCVCLYVSCLCVCVHA